MPQSHGNFTIKIEYTQEVKMVSASRKMVVSIRLAFFLLLIVFATLSVFRSFSSINTVSADSYPAFLPGFGTAMIDGVIDPTEWASADSSTIEMTFSNPSLNGTLYIMQDSNNLFLGFTVDDDELYTFDWYGLNGDSLEFEFDDNNSGILYEAGENKVIVGAYDPWILDMYHKESLQSSSYDDHQDGEARTTRQGDKNHYELRFPLCSGDTNDFCLVPGDILGLRLQYVDIYAEDLITYAV
jgi:hypothetical protein